MENKFLSNIRLLLKNSNNAINKSWAIGGIKIDFTNEGNKPRFFILIEIFIWGLFVLSFTRQWSFFSMFLFENNHPGFLLPCIFSILGIILLGFCIAKKKITLLHIIIFFTLFICAGINFCESKSKYYSYCYYKGYILYERYDNDSEICLYNCFGSKINYAENNDAAFVAAKLKIGKLFYHNNRYIDDSIIKNVSIEQELPFHTYDSYNDASSVIARYETMNLRYYSSSKELYKFWIRESENTLQNIEYTRNRKSSSNVAVVEFEYTDGDILTYVFDVFFKKTIVRTSSDMYYAVTKMYESPEDFSPQKKLSHYNEIVGRKQNTSTSYYPDYNNYNNNYNQPNQYTSPSTDYSDNSQSFRKRENYLGERCRVCEGDGDEIVNVWGGSGVSDYCEKCRKTFDYMHYHRQCQTCGGRGSY